MDILTAIEERHSVRSYTSKEIEGKVLEQLQAYINECNQDGELNIQLCLNEPKPFDGLKARYGKFDNVTNHIALIGKKSSNLEERIGYYGEKIVIKAQQLGLNTCWVAGTYSKKKITATIGTNEKLLMVIAIGYGANSGSTHLVKPIEKLCVLDQEMPAWFDAGIRAAQLAPTAMNQQKFRFILKDGQVTATPGTGFYTKVDLGIAKYHFEVGSGKKIWPEYK